jgi:hypothetical protein
MMEEIRQDRSGSSRVRLTLPLQILLSTMGVVVDEHIAEGGEGGSPLRGASAEAGMASPGEKGHNFLKLGDGNLSSLTALSV